MHTMTPTTPRTVLLTVIEDGAGGPVDLTERACQLLDLGKRYPRTDAGSENVGADEASLVDFATLEIADDLVVFDDGVEVTHDVVLQRLAAAVVFAIDDAVRHDDHAVNTAVASDDSEGAPA